MFNAESLCAAIVDITAMDVAIFVLFCYLLLAKTNDEKNPHRQKYLWIKRIKTKSSVVFFFFYFRETSKLSKHVAEQTKKEEQHPFFVLLSCGGRKTKMKFHAQLMFRAYALEAYK